LYILYDQNKPVSPRPYRRAQRHAAAELTRDRIVSAARDLLSAPEGIAGFTVEAVARRAGVARMTVYYQFGSRAGLLEAVFDSLASHRGSGRLVEAMAHPEPREGLADFVTAIAGFWSIDRRLVRRLQGLAALDPEFERIWREREGLRRQGLANLARRLSERHGRPRPGALAAAEDVLYALVAFETFDALAGPDRDLTEVAPLVLDLVRAGLNLGGVS
jgi:AcrR family transcriptional regulator